MNYFKEHFLKGSCNLRENLLHVKFIKRIAVLHDELPKASRRHKMKHNHVQRLHEKVHGAASDGQKHNLSIHLSRAQLECASLLLSRNSLASEFEAHLGKVLQGRLYQRACKLAPCALYKIFQFATKVEGSIAISLIAATIPTGMLGRFMDNDALITALKLEIGMFFTFSAACYLTDLAAKFFKTIHKLQKHEKKGAASQAPAKQAMPPFCPLESAAPA